MKKITEIRSKVIMFLDKIFESKLFTYTVTYLLFGFVIYLFSSVINTLISDYLVIEKRLLLSIPDILIFGFFMLFVVFIIYKFSLKKYQPSKFLIHLLISSIWVYVFLKWIINKQGWDFIPFASYLHYLDFIAVLLALTILLIITENLKKKKAIHKQNPFVSDDPILAKDDDKLNYHQRASYLVDYLQRSYFNKSFTIGIVGPWGNGKSSLISLIEEELNEKPKTDTIHLKFLPYLNHNEADIISEFFKQLSAEISKYSGKLSSQFLNYSDKLLKTLSNKDFTEFFKPNTSSFNLTSSYDAYQKINNTLDQLNKKYIIFIDDLDRLSNNEVLQILKLVRNTANFKNFIFLIALDKDYVLDSLIVKSDIADHTFVDKFFQLEVYLPEIDKTQLKTDFISYLKNTDLAFKPEFVRNVETCIYRNDNLFDDYISNYRSVKRLVNQLVFDFRNLPDQLDTNDLLNFTYLKMTFPYAIKYLNDNWASVIPYNSESNLCELLETEDKSKNGDVAKDIRLFMSIHSNRKLNIDFNKYQISKEISQEYKIDESNHLTKQQNILLVKTLIVLFGKENIAESYTSIKFENNLSKLLQQKVQDNDLSENKFKTVFNDNDYKKLKELLEEGYAINILNRIAYFNSIDKEEVKKVIIILLYIFDRAEEIGTHSSSVWNILSDFISRQIQITKDDNNVWDEEDKKSIWQYIEKEFIEKNQFKTETKISLLALISEFRIKLDFSSWGTTEEHLKKISLDLYKDLVNEKHNNPWDIHDYSFYGAYHDVRKFLSSNEINPITIDFWKANDNITLLCAQMTQNDAWTTKMLKTSDYANDLFGTKQNYKDFITKNSQKSQRPELKEYINFLKLESYTNFSSYVRYEFVSFDLVKQKLQKVNELNRITNDKFDNIIEIVFKSSTKDLFDISETNLNEVFGFVGSKRYSSNNSYYTFINLKSGTYHKAMEKLFQHYLDLLTNQYDENQISRKNKIITIKDTNDFIELISVQPKPYDS